MKKTLLSKITFLALALLCVGTNSVWGEATTLLEKGTSEETAWTADDVTTWGASSIDNSCLYRTGSNATNVASTTITPTANSVINVEAEWIGASNTGRAFEKGNCSYFAFGNIWIMENDQDKKVGYSLTGANTAPTTFTGDATWANRNYDVTKKNFMVIKMEINTATNMLVYLRVYSSANTETALLNVENQQLSTYNYTTITSGYNKGGGVSTTNYEWLKSIKVTETPQTVTNVSYTVKFQDEDGNTLKDDVTYTDGTTVGAVYQASATDMATFYDNAETPTKKYVYKSGQNTTATATATASDNVITLVFSTYNKTAYTVKAVDSESNELGTLATGEAFLDGSSKTYYRKCIEYGGKLYEQAAGPFSVTINATAINVTFTAADYGYYFEQSDLTLSSNKGSYAATIEKDYMSNGDGSRLYKDQTAYTTALPAGVYQVVISAATNNKYPTLTYGYRIDGVNTTLGATETWTNGSYFASKTLDNVVIPEGASFAFINAESYNSNVIIDYVTLKKTGDITDLSYTKNLSTTGYASFSAPCNVTVPEGTNAYKAAINGDKVILTKVEGIIPANTGVILYNSGKPETVTLNGTTDAAADYAGNELIATSVLANRTVNGATDAATYTYYALNAGAATFGKITADITLSDNKAYLKVAVTTEAKDLAIEFAEATGIESLSTALSTSEEAYNLQGVRVNENYKGIVIKNGKKFMIK